MIKKIFKEHLNETLARMKYRPSIVKSLLTV